MGKNKYLDLLHSEEVNINEGKRILLKNGNPNQKPI